MTETAGTYQIAIDIPFEDLVKAKGALDGAMRPGSDTASDPEGSPMFGAIRKLGLRLEPRKAQVEVLVIDHADKVPTEN